MRGQRWWYAMGVVGWLLGCASDPQRVHVVPPAPASISPAPTVAAPVSPPPVAKAVVPTPDTASSSSEAAQPAPLPVRPSIKSVRPPTARPTQAERSDTSRAMPVSGYTGSAAYYVPSAMTVNRSSSAYLMIRQDMDAQGLANSLRDMIATSMHKPADQIEIKIDTRPPMSPVIAGAVQAIAGIHTGQKMQAKLSSLDTNDFRVESLGTDKPIQQTEGGYFRWEWRVTPLRTSTLQEPLKLKLDAWIADTDSDTPLMDRSIAIEVWVQAQPWQGQLQDDVTDVLKQTWQVLKNHLAEGLAVFIGTLFLGWKKIMRRFFRRTLAQP